MDGFVEAADRRFRAPTEWQIEDFLREHGFEHVPGAYFGWYLAEDHVGMVDAKADNFILSHEGVVPVDLPMGYVDLW